MLKGGPFANVEGWTYDLYRQWMDYYLGITFRDMPDEERKGRYIAAIRDNAPDSLLKYIVNTKRGHHGKLMRQDIEEVEFDRMVDKILGDKTDT